MSATLAVVQEHREVESIGENEGARQRRLQEPRAQLAAVESEIASRLIDLAEVLQPLEELRVKSERCLTRIPIGLLGQIQTALSVMQSHYPELLEQSDKAQHPDPLRIARLELVELRVRLSSKRLDEKYRLMYQNTLRILEAEIAYLVENPVRVSS